MSARDASIPEMGAVLWSTCREQGVDDEGRGRIVEVLNVMEGVAVDLLPQVVLDSLWWRLSVEERRAAVKIFTRVRAVGLSRMPLSCEERSLAEAAQKELEAT